MFVKIMRKRNVLLEQTCDKNELLRKAQINRDNLYQVKIKVILVHLFYLKWKEVSTRRISPSFGVLFTRQPRPSGFKTCSSFWIWMKHRYYSWIDLSQGTWCYIASNSTINNWSWIDSQMDLQLRSLTTVLSWKNIYELKEQNHSKSIIIVRNPFHR